ncbi:hypothetical protein ILUMI_22688 [Ignelater luminosus]|uniref:Sulfotransferase domain-containing protein n=1 Tax=Ignelater luminosus TaxID=2038154 RepID=A0A8K0FXB4_IGNLU|nr:hypothetical protein ILUMI_22688 [Ignelater luminosus]
MACITEIGNDNEIDKLLNRVFTSPIRTGYVEVGEDKFCLPVYYQKYEESLKSFDIFEDDVFICGHPKTGTTWCSEMIWLIVNNLNYEGALSKEIYKRVSQLELCSLFNISEKPGADNYNKYAGLQYIAEAARPRCIKTHLHWSLLPDQIQNGTKKPKMVVVLRNSEDSCVSLYHHSQMVEKYTGTFEEFCTLFLAGRVCFGPFWKQVLSYWEQKYRPNLLFVKYKEMKEDLPAVIKKVSTFLGKTYTEEEIEKLSKHLSFESMKKNPAVNHEEVFNKLKEVGYTTSDSCFIRSGKVGAFKLKMSPDMIKKFEAWTKENLNGTGLSVE